MLEQGTLKKSLSQKQSELNLPNFAYSSNSPHRSNMFSGGLALSQSQSASTLQHANIAWGFSKADRFPKIRGSYEFTSILEMPSSLTSKTTSFGFGNKIVMSEVNSKFAKENPAPDRYNLKSDFDNKHKGRSFGLPHSVYAKVHIPGTNVVHPEVARNIPGPGSYNTEEAIGADKVKYTLKPRGRMFNEGLGGDTPASNYYTPSDVAISPSRFKNTTFGVGGRYDFTKAGNSYVPGPGSYKVKSRFDNLGQNIVLNHKRSPIKVSKRDF